ncbi:MAG TPA: pentapeptide repeat-containing protein [Catalimonadaceae bacterium]|jgi:uncharacterized protein YjbI with pentapeptide repeats|nr:pentapeptide repeat-containing protein [Catalimonadaceae bacterium]
MSTKILPLLGVFLIAIAGISCATGPAKKNAPANPPGSDEHKTLFKGMTFETANLATFLEHKKGHLLRFIEFEECTFTGPVKFSPLDNINQVYPASVIFRNCTFEGPIQANLTQFSGQVSFGKCRFKQLVNFQNSIFMGPVGFRECTFDQDAQFQNTMYLKSNTWMGSHFYGIGFFQASHFMEKANFSNSVFHGYSDFSLCRFDEGLSLDFGRVEGTLDLTDSRNMGLLNFRGTELKRTQLNNLRSFGLVRFTDVTFNDSLVITGARFFAEPLQVQKPKGPFPVKETN